ncbi:MAG: hypothetical protein IPM51_07785 [Sphingobacteriaceae bacterium]|nr:hypothetical protein [Sphingobacteriaceae bacterium]
MKKCIFFTLCILILFSTHSTQAQKDNKQKSASSGGSCFAGNNSVINLGVGFFSSVTYRYGKNGSYKYTQTPALSLSYEYGLPEKIGPGHVGVGAYFGYRAATYRFDDFYYLNNRYYYEHKWTYSYWAIRGVYHLDDLMNDKAELYFGTTLGIRYTKYKFNPNSNDPFLYNYELRESAVRPNISLFAGGRYYFTENIGAFLEIGYGITWLTGGLALKF